MRKAKVSRFLVIFGAWMIATASLIATAGETVDPANDGSQFAWSENTGWLNSEPLGDGGPGAQITDLGARGWIWAENIGWISLSCFNTSSCSTVNYGVSYEGAGMLGGWAWSENVGWISFSCANTALCGQVSYGVTVDTATGLLSGYAWSENIGWIVVSCETMSSCARVDYGITIETPITVHLFSDDFETSDTSRWSVSVP